MIIHDLLPEEHKRREREREMVREGIEIWKNHKRVNQDKQVKEKQEMRQLLEKYWPYGRPGGGAPNPQGVGLKNVHLEEMFPAEDMKKNSRYCGATIKWGRPGGGAPQVTTTGKKRVGFREDPTLRFQFSEDLRRAVDNTLRYRTPREEQHKYKKQLDQLIEEKKKLKEQEIKKNLEMERKMGWTNPEVMKNLSRIELKPLRADDTVTKPVEMPVEIVKKRVCEAKKFLAPLPPPQGRYQQQGGVELVSLLRRRPVKVQLCTTDVTRGDASMTKLRVCEPEYLRELTKQVNYKDQQLKAVRAEEIESCRRHFETWGNLWGKPGHGAPTGDTHKLKMDLMWLYPQPMSVH